MYERALLKERLEQIMEAVERIERRFAGIETPLDFIQPMQTMIGWMPLPCCLSQSGRASRRV
jgi:hypothetical protein